MELWIVWIIVAVVFAILELLTTAFTLIWFSVGAIIACMFDLLDVTLYGQLSVFLLVSFILIIYTRTVAKKFFESKTTHKTNLDSIIGAKGTVIADIISMDGKGQVKIKGEIWSAASKSGEVIPKDSVVVVNEIKGVTVVVSKITE